MKYQTYFLEVSKSEVDLLKQSCNSYYKICQEKFNVSNMLRLRKILYRLNSLEKKIE
jgi:hypothetical protein